MPNQYKRIPRSIRPVLFPIGPSIAYIELTQGQYALIDRSDAAIIGQYNWHAKIDRSTGNFYAKRNVAFSKWKQRLLSMHVELVKPEYGRIPDHVSGRTLDNRRANLREATPSQNSHNSAKRKDNTSGVKGVSWNKQERKWRVRVMLNNISHEGGMFKYLGDAIVARKVLSSKLHGSFVRNSEATQYLQPPFLPPVSPIANT